MQWWFYAHETRQKTIKNALFHARLLILPEKMYFSLKWFCAAIRRYKKIENDQKI
jgi:hypothetical protein